jgi:hypothetical protein
MKEGLFEYDEKKGTNWERQALNGVITKAPLEREEAGPNPTR